MLSPYAAEVTDDGHRVLVRVTGEVDHQNGPQLRDCIVHAAERGLPVELDLSNLRFLDSSGVGCLLQAGRQARMRGTTLTIARVSPSILRVLRVMGTADLFGIDAAPS